MRHLKMIILIILVVAFVATGNSYANPRYINGISIEDYSYQVRQAIYDFMNGFENLRLIFIEAERDFKALLRGQGFKDNLGDLLAKLLTGKSKEITLRGAVGIDNFRQKYSQKFSRWYENQKYLYYRIVNMISNQDLINHFVWRFDNSCREINSWEYNMSQVGRR